MMVPVIAVLAALQQPQPAPPPRAQPSPEARSGQNASAGRSAAYDSTVQIVRDVGHKVALVRSALGQFRRAAFNRADAEVVKWGDTLRTRCQSLEEAARRAPRRLCRDCTAPALRPSLEDYRSYLPQLAQAAQRCATSLRQLRRDSITAAAAGMRREVRNLGNRLVAGIRPYELRLARVREAFGWAARGTAAPRPGRQSS